MAEAYIDPRHEERVASVVMDPGAPGGVNITFRDIGVVADEAMVTFVAGHDQQFNILLCSHASVKSVTTLLMNTMHRKILGVDELVINLVRNVQPNVRMKMVAEAAVQRVLRQTTLRFVVTADQAGWLVSVLRDNKAVWYGHLSQMEKWAETYESPHELNGRVVRFWYDGGTTVGYRVVVVESILRKEGSFVIRGKDVKKDEYRSYSAEKIRDGKLLVIA